LIKQNSVDKIWEDINLIQSIQEMIDAISDLVEEQKSKPWTKKQCNEWASKAGIYEPWTYADNSLVFPNGKIETKFSLDFWPNKISELPEGLTRINGVLDLNGQDIETLPSSLQYIGGALTLDNTKVKKWPPNFQYIKRNLYIRNCPIQLPPNIKNIVKGKIVRE